MMAIWIAKFLGPVMLAVSIPMMLTPASLQETTRRFLANRPLLLVAGILAMTAGLAILNTHNVWAGDWTVIVTLLGWAMVLGGAFRIIAPGVAERVGTAMLGPPILMRLFGLGWAALGAYLTLKGYS